MDRNTIIGFILIGVLMIGMFYFNSKNRLAYEAERMRIEDSIAALKPKIDPAVAVIDSLKVDSIKVVQQQGVFASSGTSGTEVEMENDLLKVIFTTKGAYPKKVMLKNYKEADSSQVILQEGAFNKITYSVNSGPNQTAQTENLVFNAGSITKAGDGSQTIVFSIGDSLGKKITHSYTLKPNNYLLDFTIGMAGANQLLSQPKVNLIWQTEAPQIEDDFEYEKTQTEFGFVEDGSFDFERIASESAVNLAKPTSWVALKQQFFLTALVAKNKFSSVASSWVTPEDSAGYIARATTSANINLAGGNEATIPLQLYYGPSDYKILKQYNNQMEEIVPYGSGIFSFVKYINRYFLLPVWDYLQKHIVSAGMVILMLTLIIRLITSPILYRSYLSGAKMKALKPEVDAIKEKFTDPKTGELDQQGFSMEQMKLWRTAGVSPLGGCMPALLQIPIFMSLFYFFQSNIALRGKSFLWAHDLSTYDTILQLPFNIPFYGEHVSLFTLLAVVTSLAISIYGMSNMQDQSNPMMKYMPYIFPIMMLGIFNKLPSALTWYYTVSNIITLILQFVIQNYIIDHDKILAKLEENKKKPKTKSKLQARIEAMQEQQKKIQEMQKKPKRSV